MTSLLRFDDLACRRGGRLVFSGLSGAVEAGALIELTGPNGSGKTSLLRLLAGLGEAASGIIARACSIAWLGHESALKPGQTVRQEMRFWTTGDSEAALKALNLASLADLPCRLLSAGQKRRVALARVIASGAPLWLLDEPSVGLDSASLDDLRAVIARHRAGGGGVLMATHFSLDAPGTSLLVMPS
jgi:heme exporter protein A